MTTRLLPPDEWPRLVGTEAEGVWPYLDPARASVLVVEDKGEIIGTWVMMDVLHVECLWIAPAHRGKGSVARRLYVGLKKAARAIGVDVIATAALNDDVRTLLAHAGATRLPGDHYSLKVH